MRNGNCLKKTFIHNAIRPLWQSGNNWVGLRLSGLVVSESFRRQPSANHQIVRVRGLLRAFPDAGSVT